MNVELAAPEGEMLGLAALHRRYFSNNTRIVQLHVKPEFMKHHNSYLSNTS